MTLSVLEWSPKIEDGGRRLECQSTSSAMGSRPPLVDSVELQINCK